MNIFLLRGLIRERRHWCDFPQILQNALPECNIYYLEPDGVGQKNQKDSPTSITGMVQSMREEFLAQKGSENILISISLGGMIASDWALTYPDDFQKIVIMNSSFKNLSPLWKRLQMPALGSFLKILATSDVEGKERVTVDLVCNHDEVKEKITKEWIAIAKDRPVSNANAARQLYAAMMYAAKKDKPQAQALILCGKADRLAHWSCSEKIGQYWDAPVKYHPSAGHSLTEDAPDWVAQEVKTFVNS